MLFLLLLLLCFFQIVNTCLTINLIIIIALLIFGLHHLYKSAYMIVHCHVQLEPLNGEKKHRNQTPIETSQTHKIETNGQTKANFHKLHIHLIIAKPIKNRLIPANKLSNLIMKTKIDFPFFFPPSCLRRDGTRALLIFQQYTHSILSAHREREIERTYNIKLNSILFYSILCSFLFWSFHGFSCFFLLSCFLCCSTVRSSSEQLKFCYFCSQNCNCLIHEFI
jgi:hypothetical protein